MNKNTEVLDKIKIYRKNKGITHEDMAFRLEISQSAYTNIENQTSKLSVERLMKIAEILEQPISSFFVEESNSREKNFIDLRNINKELISELSRDSQLNLLKILLEKI